jgi:hypothetical protein
MRVQLHALTTLHQKGKSTRYPLNRRLAGPRALIDAAQEIQTSRHSPETKGIFTVVQRIAWGTR